ncbi:MAG: chorismate mutase [Chloroflexota bacterium]|nr:chorismate mutase [Chloroflexota bacterium]
MNTPTQPDAVSALDALRTRIDEIDRRLVDLLNERARASLEIGVLKSEDDGRVYVPEREVIVYSNILSANGGPLPDSSLKSIYDRIIAESRDLQHARTSGER